MRKLSLLIVLCGGLFFSSCAYRTCPTYTKKELVQPPVNDLEINEEIPS